MSQLGLLFCGCVLAACGSERAAPAAEEAAPPRVVVVDWLGGGDLYAARVVGERQGLTGIEYADGDREWVEESRLRPWPELVGQRVQVWIRHTATDVTVLERRGSLFHVQFEDQTDTWVSAEMLYALAASEPPADVVPPAADAPLRRPVDPETLRVGSFVLAYWLNAGSLQRGQPYLCEILALGGEEIRIRFTSDGSVGTALPQHILRVFDRGSFEPRVGQRVWTAGSTPIGRVIELRAGLVKLDLAGSEQWVDADRVLGLADAVEPERLTNGTNVTVVWQGNALYHGTVRSVGAEGVTLVWHEGSPPSAVPAEDIIEIWEAVP